MKYVFIILLILITTFACLFVSALSTIIILFTYIIKVIWTFKLSHEIRIKIIEEFVIFPSYTRRLTDYLIGIWDFKDIFVKTPIEMYSSLTKTKPID